MGHMSVDLLVQSLLLSSAEFRFHVQQPLKQKLVKMLASPQN